MKDFWKRLFAWICGVLFIIVAAFFVVGLETGEGFFGVIDNIASKVQFEPFAKIKQEAFNEGRKEGIAAGEKSGYNKGYETGFDEGYTEGFSEGEQEKMNELAREGKTYDAGYRKGYEAGKNEGKKSGAKIVISDPQVSLNEPEEPSTNYVLNKNSKKFHFPNCPSVNDIKPSNRWDFSGTREEVVAKGYVPCKRCYP